MKVLLFLSLGFSLSEMALGFRVVHYNIKELDSVKLREPRPEQVEAALAILRGLQPDVLSLNEIQYDSPGVPDGSFRSKGENAARFGKQVAPDFNVSFGPANTGRKARKRADGTYSTNPNDPEWLKLVDHVDFGIFPFQYSTAGLFRLPIIKSLHVSQLKWEDFIPGLDLSPYRDATGAPFPQSMALFDKNFTDMELDEGTRRFHVILLHTVPAYNFGNEKGLNLERNRDQLRFLEWYLTGKSGSLTAAEIGGIKPLAPDTPFIAMGDWNTDIREKSNPGSAVLERLGARFHYWHEPTITYESGFQPKPFRAQFDYILHSEHFETTAGGVYLPASERKELGCSPFTGEIPKGFRKVRYSQDGADCFALVRAKYYQAKIASDHLPIWADIRFRK